MWQRNNGRAEEELQIKFTGYLIQAIRRTQRDYLKALYAYSNQETLTDTIFAVSQTLEQEVMERLPLWEKIESSALLYALKQLDERERYVFLARVLDKRPFDVIGVQLGLSYKGTAAVYYRGFSATSFSTNFFMVRPPCSILRRGRECKFKSGDLLVPTQNSKAKTHQGLLSRAGE